MSIRRYSLRNSLSLIAALAIVTSAAAMPARAQSKTDDKKDATKPAPQKINKTGVNPRPSKRSGLQIPEPTVVLKPGEMPAIRFDQPNFDFGRIRAGKDVLHDYWFTNTGTGPLEILRVKPSCGCTTAGPHTRIVQPGETGKIPIKLSTKKGGSTVSKTVTVNTNIPGKDGTIRLTIQGSVWKPVEITPANAAFGRLSPSKATPDMQRKMTLINNVEGEMTLTNIRSDNPRFKAEVKPLQAGKKYELIVSLVPPLLEGNNRGTIKIDTGLKDYPTVDVSAFAFLTAPVDITPSTLTLVPDRTSSMKRQMYVRSNDGSTFEIKNLRCTTEKLKVSTTQMSGSSGTFQIVVDIPADYTPAPGEKIEFDTTHPAMPSMSIPVRSRASGRNRVKAGNPITQAATKSPAVIRQSPPAPQAVKPEPKQENDGEKPKKPQEMKPVG